MQPSESSAPAESSSASEGGEKSCKDFPWHIVLRIGSGVCFIGVVLGAFFCFTMCNGGSPTFRDYLLSVYIIFLAVIGLLSEIQAGMQWLYRRFNFFAKFHGRGFYSLFVASLGFGPDIFQIIPSAILFICGFCQLVYRLLAKDKAKAMEALLLPSPVDQAVAMATEAGAAVTGAASSAAATAQSRVQQMRPVGSTQPAVASSAPPPPVARTGPPPSI